MIKESIKRKLDYIPLIILIISAILLLIKVFEGTYGLMWKHYFGFISLLFSILTFYYNHKIGIITLGFILLLGLVGLLSFSPSIVIETHFIGKGDISIPFFYGQPIFLLWLLIHLILSGKYYFGIATKKYWSDLLMKKGDNMKINQE
ncbi:MAG: hypothetical protein HEQ40_11490 [Lacibacter sp.]|jgi:hypothetical protein